MTTVVFVTAFCGADFCADATIFGAFPPETKEVCGASLAALVALTSVVRVLDVADAGVAVAATAMFDETAFETATLRNEPVGKSETRERVDATRDASRDALPERDKAT